MRYVVTIMLLAASLMAQVNFTDYFEDKSMRIDIYHTGNRTSEMISLKDVIEEPYWAGSKTQLIDELVYGNYFFKVFDDSSDVLIYSRGFNHLYQEWQSTEEAKTTTKSFDGTLLFPFPKNTVRVELFKRDRRNNFEKLFTYVVDPNDYMIKRERRIKKDNFKVHYSGDPATNLDIVFIPEGYTKDELDLFKADCDSMTKYLFSYSPFDEFKDKINVWGIEAFSEESGTDLPGQNIWKKTLVNSNFWTFRSERYLMTTDYHKVRDISANAPCDQVYIIVNTAKYGGGAVYNYYSLTGAHHPARKQVFVHEFGHGLVGLADEYGNDPTYQDYYPKDVEPWEPNITTLTDFESKWKSLVDDSTPIPTPSDKGYNDVVGAFEGGGYADEGVYRPTHNSIMRAFSSNEFNEVCKEAIRRMMDTFIK